MRASVWEEQINIPTYEVGEPDKNPLFLENRVYQGSSGKVYPYPVIDKLYDQKISKTYDAVILENDYLRITFLPGLGGRIYRAVDKTNRYQARPRRPFRPLGFRRNRIQLAPASPSHHLHARGVPFTGARGRRRRPYDGGNG